MLEQSKAIREIASSNPIRNFVTPLLGESAFAVRAIFFDKVPGANWSLFWHQDNVISVKEKIEVEGFTGWSCKAGVWQVQPPDDLMSRMLAIRIHLDDCTHENGPLRVRPGSHRHGWIENPSEWAEATHSNEVECLTRTGGIMGMSPMILHASAPSKHPFHRRVIHIEYANEELPTGLEWNNRVW